MGASGAAGATPFAGFKLGALTPAAAPAATAAAEPSEEYYKQLRGLNRSFLNHLQAELAKDEFVDLCIALDKYREYRADITRKYGAGSTTAAPPNAATSSTAPAAEAGASKPAAAAAPAAYAAAAPTKPTFSPTTPFALPSASPDATEPAGTPTSTTTGTTTSLPAFGAAASTSAFKLPPLAFGSGSSGSTVAAFNLFGAPAVGSGAPLFGAPAAAGAGGAGEDGDDGDDDEGPIPAEEPTKADQFKKGAGEEDEDTLLELEGVKLFEFQKEAKSWKTIGAGLLRINENRTTHKRRLLSRSEGVGQVLLNTNLFAGMTAAEVPDAKTPSVRLLCALADKGIVQILARLPSKADVAKLVEAIEKYRPAS